MRRTLSNLLIRKGIGILILLAVVLINFNCRPRNGAPKTLFVSVPASESGIAFNNTLIESEDFNIIEYLYFYNGGGVAVGDVNNDGLPDIYFTSNQGSNKLYINKGNLKFEDVTEKAGVADSLGWKTGVTMVDINADGWLDMYVSHVSNFKNLKGHNQLFINNHDGTFSEQSAKYGLDITGLCTQAAFFDADGDGDLDCYILRHSVHSARTLRDVSFRNQTDSLSSDLLLKNYGGKFSDVSAESGIHDGALGYGLGIAVADLNGDGAPDLYISNDFHDNDYVYYNDGKGKFTEAVAKSMGHTSNFSMGNDISDLDNDGLPDVLTLDMKPEDESLQKSAQAPDAYNIFEFKHRAYGFHYQYARNMVQHNRGVLDKSNHFSVFSEVAQSLGMSATDWSWSVLAADFDNDGNKDVFITNGILRRPNNLDYIKYISNKNMQQNASNLDIAKLMPDGKAANYAFKNNGNLHFENVSAAWGLNLFGCSNGAAYADFDNDGDLDLVVNNLNAPASLLINQTMSKKNIQDKTKSANETPQSSNNKSLRISFKSNTQNTFGIGAKAIVYCGDSLQYNEVQTTRGFQSSVEPILHFGVGTNSKIDSIRIIWRDGKTQLFPAFALVQPCTNIVANYSSATLRAQSSELKAQSSFVFEKDKEVLKLTPNNQQLTTVNDIEKQKLIPHFLSTEGPKLAVGDVNGDGLEDFYVGGAQGQSGNLFLQNKNGTFKLSPQNAFLKDAGCSDVGAVFFDADGDGDTDLYVVSGGFQFLSGDVRALDRLYLNDGKGNFTKTEKNLPQIFHNGSCVKVGDFDGDGAPDLFVGSRSDMNYYGVNASSYLLHNNGKGIFTEVSAEFAPFLKNIGMVTDAAFADLDKNGSLDLVIVGEFMPITLCYNFGGSFQKLEMENTGGWWRTVCVADLDKDGDLDILVGNIGTNTELQATDIEPVGLYVKDFDGNGDIDALLTYYRQNKNYTVAHKDELISQMPSLRKRFPEYETFANSTFNQIFPKAMQQGALVKKAQQLRSVVLWNKPNREWEINTLPDAVQFSSAEAFYVADFNGDKIPDVLVGGNFYEMIPSIGRCDASYGTVLLGNGNGGFTVSENRFNKLFLNGAVRDLKKIGNRIAIAYNNAPLEFISIK